VAAVAREFWVGWGTIMAAVRDHGQPRIDEAARLDHVGVVGVDETAFRAASTSHPTQFVTGIVDLTRRTGGVARLLDVVPGRSADALNSWITAQTPSWRAGISAASLDSWAAIQVFVSTASRVSKPRNPETRRRSRRYASASSATAACAAPP
jgi:transposase